MLFYVFLNTIILVIISVCDQKFTYTNNKLGIEPRTQMTHVIHVATCNHVVL